MTDAELNFYKRDHLIAQTKSLISWTFPRVLVGLALLLATTANSPIGEAIAEILLHWSGVIQ